jgi:hypothetical protein
LNKLAWWKTLPLGIILYGVQALLVAVIPEFSATCAVIAAGLAFTGVVSIVAYRSFESWWGRLIALNAWTMLLFGMVIRIWAYLIFSEWIWLGLLFPLYVLAWLIPVLLPDFSRLLFREQFEPQTRLGKGCLRIFIAVGFSGVGLSATYAYYALRRGERQSVFFLAALMGTVVVIALSQVFSHQLWQQRPWRNNRPKRGDE